MWHPDKTAQLVTNGLHIEGKALGLLLVVQEEHSSPPMVVPLIRLLLPMRCRASCAVLTASVAAMLPIKDNAELSVIAITANTMTFVKATIEARDRHKQPQNTEYCPEGDTIP
jgi:hypothetical protein